MILIFVLGYLCIALEHKLRIDKAAIALLMCGALWTVPFHKLYQQKVFGCL